MVVHKDWAIEDDAWSEHMTLSQEYVLELIREGKSWDIKSLERKWLELVSKLNKDELRQMSELLSRLDKDIFSHLSTLVNNLKTSISFLLTEAEVWDRIDWVLSK